MKVSNETAISLLTALSAMDGYDRVLKNGNGEQVVKEFYKFGGKVRLNIARNINMLSPVVSTYQSARNGLINEITGGKGMINPKEEPELAVKAVAADNELLREGAGDIPLIPIKIDDLRLDDNDIPASRLAALSPILTE